MHLKSLEVQGFKSFPDKTLLRFGGDITAIVGPNGSGKSNISDAILWVLGEQSSKTLRGGRMEDVIFGGTQKRSALGFAEATLTLDNSDRALLYDADEVMITRRYYRSGESEYYVNKQSARLRDINELFMDTGLGREGYSNIGQGRIDEILSLKSADRREIFEEAAGISKYRHRKEETERRLAATEDNLLRIGDKVSELELQLEPLREQSEKAKSYLALKDSLRSVEVAVWMDSLDRLSAAAKKAEEDYASASFVLKQAHEDLDRLYAQAEELTDLLRRKDGELEAARGRVAELESGGQQLTGQMTVLQGSLDNNRDNIRRIQEELRSQQDRSGGIEGQLSQAHARVADIAGLLEEKKNALGALERDLAAMTANAQGLTRRFLELREQETGLTAQLAGREADLRALFAGMEESRHRRDTLVSDLSSGALREQNAQGDLDDCRRALSGAREEAAAAANAVAGYELRLSKRQARWEELDRAARAQSGALEGIQAKLRVFQAMERDYESYQKSVKLVMREAQRGALKHIHGPVSRLIRTEDAYTTAIEIALGGALQQIVVDTEADAKAAIGYLKRTGGGRATFLPISAVKGRTLEEQGLSACPGFVGVASSLVRCREEYRQIIENLLGRTVVAEDLDRAIAMAKRYSSRFRIVTLDGQLMNPGGSMTGGSVSKESGLLSRANEVEKLQAQAEKAQAELLAGQQALQEALRLREEAAFQLTGEKDRQREAEDQVLRLQGQEKQYEVLLQAIRDAQAAAQREKDALDARERTDREQYAAQTGKIQALQEQLAQTRQALTALEGSQSQTAQAVEAIHEKMTGLRAEEAALEAERTTAQGHIRDLEDLRSAMAGDRDQKLALIASLEAECGSLEDRIAEKSGDRDQTARRTETARQELADLLADRAQTEAEKTRTEREAQDKNKDILTMERACALLEQKKLASDMEERQIVDRLWDSYGLTPGTAGAVRGTVESAAAGNRQIAELKRKIAALGTPNLGAVEEYARVKERYDYLSTQRDDVETSKRELESILKDITQEMTSIFLREFQKINEYFGKTFAEMFGGGRGQLLLEDPGEPLSCGIEIRVQPPGKQVKTITLLSGGEKAFVAIALYFAILKVRPTPFCMLDEIDAALDDRNVERFASYLHNLSQNTQFIVITHRRGTMEASDVLYGVTMQEQGVSKLLRLDLNQMEQYLGIL